MVAGVFRHSAHTHTEGCSIFLAPKIAFRLAHPKLGSRCAGAADAVGMGGGQQIIDIHKYIHMRVGSRCRSLEAAALPFGWCFRILCQRGQRQKERDGGGQAAYLCCPPAAFVSCHHTSLDQGDFSSYCKSPAAFVPSHGEFRPERFSPATAAHLLPLCPAIPRV